MSWGEVFGKIFNWVPKRREHYRNKIEEIKREMDELQYTIPSDSNVARYRKLADQLRKYRKKAKNT